MVCFRVEDGVRAHLLGQFEPVVNYVDSEDSGCSVGFAETDEAAPYRPAAKDSDSLPWNLSRGCGVDCVSQWFLGGCDFYGNLSVVDPGTLLGDGLVFGKTTVHVDAPKLHPFTDVSVSGPTLETLPAGDMGLA